jgi:hypothetical protein
MSDINVSAFFFLQDTRGLNQLMSKHGTNTAQELDDKSLTICSGLDMVNINYLHVVCESAEQAKVSIVFPILLSSGGLGYGKDSIRTEIHIEFYCTPPPYSVECDEKNLVGR